MPLRIQQFGETTSEDTLEFGENAPENTLENADN